MGELVKLCSIEEIKEGALTSIDVEGIKLMVTLHKGKYIATTRICTHKTYDLTKGHYADGYVTCLLHTSSFDLEDGEAQNPPAIEALEVYNTKVINDELYLEI
ncbi:MAG: Rieske (2Fe-2S) protein [Candidatus Kariarchaeaceae archaeon]|jgi:3-phenylpropionate/trans-cinnamate dioxygenase ferredoxin subunit